MTRKNAPTIPPDAIRPELLFTELNGGLVDEDDYLAQSVKELDTYSKNVDDFRLPSDAAIHWSDRQRIIEENDVQNGFAKFTDGCWYVASDIVFEEVSADMFVWWLNYCDSNEKFRWWHPNNYIQGGWDPQFYATPFYERESDYFVNHAHVIKHSVGNFRGKFHNDFIRAENYFDCTTFEDHNVKHCILARSHIYDPSYGDIAFGFLLYVLVERGGKLCLRTRLWLGSFERVSGGLWFNMIANTKLFRRFCLSESVIKSLWRHIDEQSICLAAFLPKLYRRELEVDRSRNRFELRGFVDSGDTHPAPGSFTNSARKSGYFYGADDDDDDDEQAAGGGADATSPDQVELDVEQGRSLPVSS